MSTTDFDAYTPLTQYPIISCFKKSKRQVIKLDIEFEISEEQAEAFAAELYYNSDLITIIKETIECHREDYERFLEKEGKKNG